MLIEIAMHGMTELPGESPKYKTEKYGRCNIPKVTQSKMKCYFCGFPIADYIADHVKKYKAIKVKCNNCKKVGHYEEVSRSKPVHELEITEKEIQQISIHSEYRAKMFSIELLKPNIIKKASHEQTNNFRTHVVVNNHLSTVLFDIDTKSSACGLHRTTE